MVEDEPHEAPTPDLTLTTELATALLQAVVIEATLEQRTLVRRVLHEHLFERPRPSAVVTPQGTLAIEVVHRDPPHLVHVAAEQLVVATGRRQPELAQRLGVVEGGADRFTSFFFTVPWHERMFSWGADGKAGGAPSR